jgi:hypothetical protein
LPEADRETVRAAHWRWDSRARLFKGDDSYLDEEYQLCARHHRTQGTQPGCIASLLIKWLADPRTGERAHERMKRQTERTAEALERQGVLSS